MPLQWQTVHLPLAQGVDTKSDPRARPTAKLAVLENGRFVEPGGIQKRYGNALLSAYSDQGGSITAPRKLVEYRNELLLFTQHALHSYDGDGGKWIKRGDHDAVVVDELPIAGKVYNQTVGDRAELNGKTFYVWESTQNASAPSWIRVTTSSSGAVTTADYSLGTGVVRPHVLAMATKVLLIAFTGSNTIKVKAIDPDDPTTGITGAWTTVGTNVGTDGWFDVVKQNSTTALLVYAGNPSTQYSVGTITEALVVTMVVKTRNSDDIMSVAYSSESDRVVVVRLSITTVIADLLNGTTLADITVSTTIGTVPGGAPTQFTCAFKKTTDGGYYRCYVWFAEATIQYNWINTNAATGTAAVFARRCDLASRAFVYDSDVYVCVVVSSNYQASLFLCARANDSGEPVGGIVHAKMLSMTAAPPARECCLPTVTNTSGNKFAFCGIMRERISVPGAYVYANMNPVDIVMEFDAHSAREGHEVGESLYISGGVAKLYDGLSLVEAGFHVWPEGVLVTAVAGGALTASAVYYYRIYWEWVNDRGEREQSTYAETAKLTTDVTNKKASIVIPSITLTEKQRHSYATSHIGIAIYRTEANSAGPYHRVSSLNPTATGDNGAAFNDPTAVSVTFTDVMTDATLITKEIDYRSRSELDNVVPPANKVIASGQDRLFVSQDYTVRFSKLHFPGDMVAFNDALTILLPRDGGVVTGLSVLDTALIIFTARRIYACTGTGPNNVGVGEYGAPQLVAVDVGCKDQRTIVHIPNGVMFLSDRGFYLLDRSMQVQYIGAPVEDYNTQTFTSGVLINAEHQVRFTTSTSSGKTLVYDYLVDQWSTWDTLANTACISQGVYFFGSGLQVRQESKGAFLDDSTADYGLIVETAWIKVAQLQGYGRVRWLAILGEWRSTHNLRVRVAYDYKDTWVDDVTWSPPASSAGDPLQLRMRTSRQKVEALKVRIEDIKQGTTERNEALKLTGLSLEVGFKPGLMRLPAAQTA